MFNIRVEKTTKYTIMSLVFPMVILVMVYYLKGIFPGGPHTVLAMDLQAQYMPFFALLRYLGKSDNSLFLNLSGALGNNYLGSVYYNLFSPMIWLTTLFSLENLPNAIYFITLVRIGLCGGGFCYYLFDTYEEKHYMGAFLLSCCYALMSYNIGYSINVIWLDAVFLLPWMLTGAERILRGRRPVVYIISITASMVFNYYLTCMSLIFVAIYIFIRLFELNKWSLKKALYIIYSTLVAVMISMPVVLPGICALKEGKMDEETYPLLELFRYNIIDVFSQLFSGRYDTVYDDGLPLIFCGTGTLLLVFFYFIKDKARRSTKLLYAVALAFYLFSMCFIPLDRAMHGFRETTCFEVRYSYAFSCLLLIIAYRGIDGFTDLLRKYNDSKLIKSVVSVFVIIELFMNSSIIIAGLMVELHYNPTEEYLRILQTKREMLESINDADFYRISDNCAYTYNDGAWLGYNGFGYFSSCYNLKIMNYLGNLGECQSYHALKDGVRTPLEESLLGAKYRLTYADSREDNEEIYRKGLYSVSKNPNALSLGYMIQSDAYDSSYTMTGDAFTNQNNLAKELSGIEKDVFVELDHEEEEEYYLEEYARSLRFKIRMTNDAPLWLYVESADRKTEKEKSLNDKRVDSKLTVNGISYGELRRDDSFFMIYLGEYSKGDVLEIDAKSTIYFSNIHVAYMDESIYCDVINQLSKRQLKIKEHGNGMFYGYIDAGEGGNMLLTLPAMNGWRIKVDGKDVPTDSYKDVMLLIHLSEGEHEISMKYLSPGVYLGLICGLLGVLFMIIQYCRGGKDESLYQR